VFASPSQPLGHEARREKALARIDEIERTQLAGTEAVRSLTPAQWRELVTEVQAYLGVKQRAAWARKLNDAFVPDDAALRALRPEELAALIWTLDYLSGELTAQLLRRCLSSREYWGAAPPEILLNLLMRATEYDETKLVEGRALVTPELLEDLEKAFAGRALEAEALELLARLWLRLGRTDRAADWTARAAQACVAGANPNLARLQAVCLLGREAGARVGLQQVVLDLADQGRLDSGSLDPGALAWTVESDVGRKALRARLQDQHKSPRLGVSKVLSYAYAETTDLQQMQEWRSFLNERVEEGEAKALWLAAKAYNENLAFADQNQHQRAHWLKEAYRAAGNEEQSWLVLQEFVDCLRAGGFLEQAVRMLADEKRRFTGARQSEVEALAGQLEEECARLQVKNLEEQQGAQRNRQATRLKYLREQEARAAEAGDFEEAKRLQSTATLIEEELK
jgi:hypothetical protein